MGMAIFIGMLIFLSWLFFLILGMGLGGELRGRPIAGFLWSFFLGPIGVLIAIFGYSDKRPHCPHCGGVIVKGKDICKNCGNDVYAV